MMTWPLMAALAVAVAGVARAVDPVSEIPAAVLRYIARSVAAQGRRAGWSEAQREDVAQAILARLWADEPDLSAWAQFGNTTFHSLVCQRFHRHLIDAVRNTLERAMRTPRLEVGATAQGDAPEQKRRRRYLKPDRPLADLEAREIVSREPGARDIDRLLDLQAAFEALPAQSRLIASRKLIDRRSWNEIAAETGLKSAYAQRLYREALAQLAGRLRSYNGSEP